MQCINVIEIIKLISATTAADEILSTKQSASKRKQYSNWRHTHTHIHAYFLRKCECVFFAVRAKFQYVEITLWYDDTDLSKWTAGKRADMKQHLATTCNTIAACSKFTFDKIF